METADLNSKTVGGTLAYCEWLMAKGYATAAQVNPWRTAIQKVFSTVEGESWESLDLSAADLEEYMSRFQTLAGTQYKAESIAAYKRRVQNAIDAHDHYLQTGRPPNFRQGAHKERKDAAPAGKASGATLEAVGDASRVKPVAPEDGLMDFPFPLKGGHIAVLRLPQRITSDDANRLGAFLRTLQDDSEERRQLPPGDREAA